jgi:hypothetical protein
MNQISEFSSSARNALPFSRLTHCCVLSTSRNARLLQQQLQQVRAAAVELLLPLLTAQRQHRPESSLRLGAAARGRRTATGHDKRDDDGVDAPLRSAIHRFFAARRAVGRRQMQLVLVQPPGIAT